MPPVAAVCITCQWIIRFTIRIPIQIRRDPLHLIISTLVYLIWILPTKMSTKINTYERHTHHTKNIRTSDHLTQNKKTYTKRKLLKNKNQISTSIKHNLFWIEALKTKLYQSLDIYITWQKLCVLPLLNFLIWPQFYYYYLQNLNQKTENDAPLITNNLA